MDLQLETRQEGEVAVVAAAGEVDVFTAPGLDAAISAELGAGRSRIVVDLTGVTFLAMAAALGAGQGAVFGWVPRLAPSDKVGSVSGVVAAAGRIASSVCFTSASS